MNCKAEHSNLLLSKDDDILAGTSSTLKSENSKFEESAVSPGSASAAVLGLCTLAVVMVALSLVIFVSFLPLWIYLLVMVVCQAKILFTCTGALILLPFILMNCIHLTILWVSPAYLSFFRKMLLPIRRLLLPVIVQISLIESIREAEPTQYYKVPSGVPSPEFRRTVRRHYRRMEKIYQEQPTRHVCVRAESDLCLRDAIPVIWEHQKRCTTHPIVDFVKRALVVTVVPDGILDLYYDEEDNGGKKLVSVQFSILQGTVWHWFMYFCRTSHSRAGIWWHGTLLAIERGHALSNGVGTTSSRSTGSQEKGQQQFWVNVHMHQQESKKNAGYSSAYHTQLDVLTQVYPWSCTQSIPSHAMQVRLWDGDANSIV